MDLFPSAEAVVVGVVCGVATGLLAWRAGWLQDERGAWQVRRPHVAVVLFAALAGAVSGSAHGVPAGIAVVAAAVDVPVAMLLAWGLAGGDGEPDSLVAALLGLGVFFGAILAFGVAAATGADATARDVALVCVPATAFLAAQPFTAPPGRLRTAVYGVVPLLVPPALLAAA